MYYLQTQEGEIIAAGTTLLERIGFRTIKELHQALLLKTLIMEESSKSGSLRLSSGARHEDYFMKKEKLTTIIGTLFLIQLRLKQDPKACYISKPKQKGFVIDSEAVSKKIGISQGDYHGFLSEYFSSAVSLESELKSDMKPVRDNAITKLLELSETLCLVMIQPSLFDIDLASNSKERIKAIEGFYSILIQINTLNQPSNKYKKLDKKQFFGNSATESNMQTVTDESQKSIERVMQELSVPKEFVVKLLEDFVQQSKDEIAAIKAHTKADNLLAIQEIAHSLKGAASNLRLTKSAQTLSILQHTHNLTEVPSKLADFEAQVTKLKGEL